MPQDPKKMKNTSSMVHKNPGVQNVVDQARKNAMKANQLLASKKE